MHSVNYNCVFIVPSRLVWQQSSIGSLCVCGGGGGGHMQVLVICVCIHMAAYFRTYSRYITVHYTLRCVLVLFIDVSMCHAPVRLPLSDHRPKTDELAY